MLPSVKMPVNSRAAVSLPVASRRREVEKLVITQIFSRNVRLVFSPRSRAAA